MRRPIEIPITGQLDKDSDLQFLNTAKGDYPELVDMEFSEQDVMTQTTARGNAQKIDFGSAGLQNQKVRVYWQSSANPTTIEVYLVNTNGQRLQFGQYITDGGLVQFREAIQSIFTSFIFPGSVTVYPNEEYLDVEIDLQYSDWTLETESFTYAVIQEAVSATGSGAFMPIGSFDFLGDIFYWTTTQRNLKSEITQGVTNAVTDSFGRSVVTIPFHGLSNFETIAINGVIGCTGVNGIWVVKVIDNNRVELQGSIFGGAYVSGGEVFKNLYGYGSIGVAKYDLATESFQWIPLLRSKQLNFVTKKEIYNPMVELNGGLISMYYTDDYNLPRVTYYRGTYIPDGCIRALNPLGQYDYQTLNDEIALQVNFSGYDLSFLEQIQTGGSLSAGNKRYAVRFLTESLNASEVSLLTNPIPVYAPQYLVDTDKIYGNPSNETTGKINRLQLTGITAGVFKYVELICFNYRGGELPTVAVDAIIVRREPLLEDQTEIILEHNGNEIGTVNFDAGLANQVQPDIVRAKDLTLIQNRLVLGSVTTSPEYDLTEFCKTLTYSIKRFPIFGAFGAQTFYEFYDPEKVVENVGYQQWEWYRYYLVGELFSGKLTQAFFLFDVRFISQSDYALPEWANEFTSTNETNRRDLSDDDFTDYDLSQNTREYLQYFLRVKGFDWDYQIEGVPIKNLFRSFKIFRAERRAEVLGSGVIHLSQVTPGVAGTPLWYDNIFATGTIDPITGVTQFDQGQANQRNRSLGSFYSPDFLFQNNEYTRISGDKLLVFGQFKVERTLSGSDTFPAPSTQRIYSSEFMSATAAFYDIDNSVFIDSAERSFVGASEYKKYISVQTPSSSSLGDIQSSIVIKTNTDIQNNSSNTDYGFYSSLIFRKLVNKYGSTVSNNIVVYTQSSAVEGNSFVDVYGGDVFCQQTWLKNRETANDGYQSLTTKLGGGGYNIISQNRVNTNLRVWNPLDTGELIFPLSTTNFVAWLESSVLDTIKQNSGYKIINQVQATVVYDPEGQDTTQYLARKWYSELKPNGSKIDFYRVFLPLNFQDNPAVQGSIFRVLNVNNELFTVQERGYTREYFNSRGQLVSPDAGQVLIGDGSVLTRIGTNLTQFGTSNAGSVVVGKSQSGKDVVMFISSQFGQVLRFGDDGLVSVSLRERMRTFFNNNLKWAQEATTPADGFGITGVWDNNNKQFIYTVKAWRQVDEWANAVTYNQGAVVLYGYNNQGVANLWLLVNAQSRGEVPGDSSAWTQIPITDNNYFNTYTFTWSELKGAFTQFYSFLPNHYTEWNGGLLSAYPDLESANRSLVYQHGIGNPAEYYGIQFPGGKISVVCNWRRNLNKKFFSLMLNGKGKPERVDITSLFRDQNDDEIIKVSFLVSSDFETRESYSYAPVKLELDANGSNDGDTGEMEGIWAKFAITYPVGKQSSISSFVAHIRDSFRNFTR